MVKTKNLTLMVTAAVLAALTCVATMVVQIPMPLTKGYVNLGDVMVLTSVWALRWRICLQVMLIMRLQR